jgi:outer membrane protein
MKRSLSLICMLVSAFGASAFAQTATSAPEPPSAPGFSSPAAASIPSAAPTGPAKIAVILFQQAVAQTNEGQRDFAQLRTKFEPKQNALKQQSDEIDTLKKQLQASGSTLSDTERQQRTRSIDEKEKALQRSAEDAQNDFQGEMNDLYQQLAQKVYGVMQNYVQQNQFTVVLDASQQQSPVLWVTPASNITEAVVQAYNQQSGVPAQPGAGAANAPASRTSPNHAPTTPRGSTTRTTPHS